LKSIKNNKKEIYFSINHSLSLPFPLNDPIYYKNLNTYFFYHINYCFKIYYINFYST
jgi:hypothetical protein